MPKHNQDLIDVVDDRALEPLAAAGVTTVRQLIQGLTSPRGLDVKYLGNKQALLKKALAKYGEQALRAEKAGRTTSNSELFDVVRSVLGNPQAMKILDQEGIGDRLRAAV